MRDNTWVIRISAPIVRRIRIASSSLWNHWPLSTGSLPIDATGNPPIDLDLVVGTGDRTGDVLDMGSIEAVGVGATLRETLLFATNDTPRLVAARRVGLLGFLFLLLCLFLSPKAIL